MKWQEGVVGSLNIWSAIRHQDWTIPATEHQGIVPVIGRPLYLFVSLPPWGQNLTMPELWTLWSYSYCIQQKQEMLCIILFSVHLLCILALLCIINEFYILIDKVKSNEFLNYTHTPFKEMKCELDFWVVCACVHVCMWGLAMEAYVWVNILNWTMLNCLAWKRMSWQARGKYSNHVNIYLSKQNVNILFYSLHQGLLFQCKCEPIIFILELLASSLCIALLTSDFNLI